LVISDNLSQKGAVHFIAVHKSITFPFHTGYACTELLVLYVALWGPYIAPCANDFVHNVSLFGCNIVPGWLQHVSTCQCKQNDYYQKCKL